MTRYFKDPEYLSYTMEPGMLGGKSVGFMPWKSKPDGIVEEVEITREEYDRLESLCDKSKAMFAD